MQRKVVQYFLARLARSKLQLRRRCPEFEIAHSVETGKYRFQKPEKYSSGQRPPVSTTVNHSNETPQLFACFRWSNVQDCFNLFGEWFDTILSSYPAPSRYSSFSLAKKLLEAF
jgi:hypothetical protein